MKQFISFLASIPGIFILLRRILEFGFTGEKKVLKNELSHLADDCKILDLGCGTGEFSVFFDPKNYTGIDIEPVYIEFAKKHFKGKFITTDAQKLDFPDNFFDAIVVLGVFHHIEDDVCLKIFDEMRRIVKPEGKILIMEDVDPENKFDFAANIIHRLDKGANIRTAENYRKMFSPKFKIEKNYRVRSGVCPYEVFVCKS